MGKLAQKKRTMPAGEFKAKCLRILDEVALTGRSLVVTKHGKPVAQILPLEKPRSLKGSVVFHGDILEPIDVVWDANR